VAKKFKSFESRRQFLAEYDVFLADDRIINLLPAALGSVFYKSATKRPITVSLTGKERWGKKQKKTALDRLKPKRKNAANDGSPVIGKPEDVAQDIEKALSSMVVNLSPSTSLSIKVAYAGWPAEWITANVCAAVERVVTKYIPGQWDGLKALHLKGPETAALPFYMADTIWDDEKVLDEGETAPLTNFSKTEKKGKKKAKSKANFIEDGVPLQIEAPSQKEPKSKKRKHKDADKEAMSSSPKRTKVVILEPLDESDTKEAKRQRDAQQKLLEEVSRKVREAEKADEGVRQKAREEERRRREHQEKYPDSVPVVIRERK
jgi:ribosome biogenesis protein UTP30